VSDGPVKLQRAAAEDDPEGLAHHRHASVRFPPDPGALAAEV